MASIPYTNQTQTAGTSPLATAAVPLSPWQIVFGIIGAAGVFVTILNFNCDTSLLAKLYKRRSKFRDVEHAGGAVIAEKVATREGIEPSPSPDYRSPSPALPFQTSMLEEPNIALPGGIRERTPPAPTPTVTGAISEAVREAQPRSDATSPSSDDFSSEHPLVGPPSAAPTSPEFSSPDLSLDKPPKPNLKLEGLNCKSTAVPDRAIATVRNRLQRAGGSDIASDPAFAAAFGSHTTLGIITASQSQLPKTDLIEQWVQKSHMTSSTSVSTTETKLNSRLYGSMEYHLLQHQIKRQDLRRHLTAPALDAAQTCADSEELLDEFDVD